MYELCVVKLIEILLFIIIFVLAFPQGYTFIYSMSNPDSLSLPGTKQCTIKSNIAILHLVWNFFR